MNAETKTSHGESQARAQFASVAEMVRAVKDARARDDGEYDWEAEAARLGLIFGPITDDDGDVIEVWHKPDAPDKPGHDDAEAACRAFGGKHDYPDEDDARQAIEQDALSVEVRSGWYNPCHPDKEAAAPEEYRILLCTGGPAVQIVGELDRWNQPETARIQFQDWFTSWQDWRDLPEGFTHSDVEETLLEYARHFFFGE